MTEPFFRLLDAASSATEPISEIAENLANKVDGWETFGRAADIIGVLSFIISLPTLFIAQSTKKAIKKHDDIKEYKVEIDKHIISLEGYLTTIEVDDIYNEKILDALYKEMDSLLIQYESVVKPYRRKLNKIKKFADEATKQIANNPQSRYNKTKLIRLLNQVV